MDGLSAMALRPLTRGLGWSRPEVEVLLASVRQYLNEGTAELPGGKRKRAAHSDEDVCEELKRTKLENEHLKRELEKLKVKYEELNKIASQLAAPSYPAMPSGRSNNRLSAECAHDSKPDINRAE